MSPAQPGRSVLVLTNMWPADDAPARGGFVRDQVRDLERLAPDWRFDRLVIDGRRGRAQYLRGILELRRRVRDGFDLIHAHYGLTGAVAAFQRRAPYVVTFHGSDIHIPWQRRVSRLGGRTAAARIFVSDRLRSAAGAGGDHVIPCGVDLDRFRPGGSMEARRQLGIPEDALVVVFPGDPARPVKNYPLFRAALEALPAALRERLREIPLAGLPPDEVPKRLQAADAVLVTSRYEGAGSVAKEAVACGTPVVSVDVGDIPTVVEGLPGCAIAERDPGALSRALAAALEPRPAWDGRARLSALGVDSESVARRVLAVYRGAMADAAAGP